MTIIKMKKDKLKVLITVKDWFYAPDNQLYKGIFGEINENIFWDNYYNNKPVAIGNISIPAGNIISIIISDSIDISQPTKGFCTNAEFGCKEHQYPHNTIYLAKTIKENE